MDMSWLRTVVNKNFGTDNLDAIFDNFAPNLSAMISQIWSNTNEMKGNLDVQTDLMGDVRRELQDIRIHSSEAYWKGRFEEEQKKVADLQKQLEKKEEELNKFYEILSNMNEHLGVMSKKIEG